MAELTAPGPQRGWRARRDAAKKRSLQTSQMADIRALRHAAVHGLPVDPEVEARVQAAYKGPRVPVAAPAPVVAPAPAPVAPEPAPEPADAVTVTFPAEGEEDILDPADETTIEPKKTGRARKG